MQATGQSITSSKDQPGASQASVSSARISMQPGRKFKREWIDSHNASVSSSQDRGVTPYQALPGPSRPMQGENDVAPTALDMQAANLNVSFQILFLANDSFSRVNLKECVFVCVRYMRRLFFCIPHNSITL